MKSLSLLPLLLLTLLVSAPACSSDVQETQVDFPSTLQAAEQGNADAQYNLGFMYANGQGVAQDYKEAVKWYRRAADQGHADALWALGNLVNRGQGGPENKAEAQKWIRKAAEQGHKKAREYLTALDFLDQFIEKQEQELAGINEALEKNQQALAKLHREQAQTNYILGLKYYNGHKGEPQDYTEARKLFLEAAKQGHAKAQFSLGVMCGLGQGGPQDYAEARKWYLKAAEQGHITSQFNSGIMYGKGQGGPQDYAEERKWYLKAAEQGHAKAQFNLGVMYGKGQGRPQDYAEARKWYLKAAEQGHSEAQALLGQLYGKGQGGPRDYAEERKWYLKAAEQGHVASQFNLGIMYGKGRGGPQDYAEARKWYLKAAVQGYAKAQAILGEMYYKGRGGRVDYKLAYAWFHAAAEQGHEKAITNRRVTGTKLNAVSRAEARILAEQFHNAYIQQGEQVIEEKVYERQEVKNVDVRKLGYSTLVSLVLKVHGSPELNAQQYDDIAEILMTKYPNQFGDQEYRSSQHMFMYFNVDEEYYPAPEHLADFYIFLYAPESSGYFSGDVNELRQAIIDWESIEVTREDIREFARSIDNPGYKGPMRTSPAVSDFRLRLREWDYKYPDRTTPIDLTRKNYEHASSDYLKHRDNILRGTIMDNILRGR